MTRILEDLTGRTYGEWTVVRRGQAVPTIKETMWTCRCSCGAESDVPKSNLARGRSTKCVVCRSKQLSAIRRAARKPKVVKPKRLGSNHHRWKGDQVGYSAAHARIRRQRGAPSTHRCVDCGAQAKDWSRDITICEATMISERGLPFCTHLEHYSPRCRDCHNRLDHSGV